MAKLSVSQFKKRTKTIRIVFVLGILVILIFPFYSSLSIAPTGQSDVVPQYVFWATLFLTAFLTGILASVSSELALEHSEKQVDLAEKREEANEQANLWQVYTHSLAHLNGDQLWMRRVAICELKQLAVKNPNFYLAKVLSVLHEFVKFPPKFEGEGDLDQALKLEARADIRAANTAIDTLCDVSH